MKTKVISASKKIYGKNCLVRNISVYLFYIQLLKGILNNLLRILVFTLLYIQIYQRLFFIIYFEYHCVVYSNLLKGMWIFNFTSQYKPSPKPNPIRKRYISSSLYFFTMLYIFQLTRDNYNIKVRSSNILQLTLSGKKWLPLIRSHMVTSLETGKYVTKS